MINAKIASTVIAGLFPLSEKAVSEKLSTEEHNAFASDVTALNQQIENLTITHDLAVSDLATANATIATLTAEKQGAEAKVASISAQLATVTAERDTFKGHYDAAAKLGTGTGKEDENSRQKVETSSYNANAMEIFNKTHGKA
jgi:multidrug resistance efflux pump